MNKTSNRTLSVLFENSPDALVRIIGLLSRRDIAVNRMSLDRAEGSPLYMLTVEVVVSGHEWKMLVDRLCKLIPVIQAGEPGRLGGEEPY
ncbi:ACT domain-containing protein [Paenibacillus elgii]|uniref:ACT domain-containing protein n=1 Tax=Paenibacillus elgii TaxID=189691 RepID=UPI001300C953|nr:ACT domain-containing protein [Paenibacillus elgii]